jgi:hypothetical protein
MSTQAFNINLGTFKEFSSYVSKFGFSITNFYDVHFDLNNNTGNLNNIFKRIPGGNSISLNDTDTFNVKGLMRFYAEECSIPGFQISTGEYRITNSPQLKYAYGIVNNEITFSFIGDANSDIRKTFDAWQSYIYAHNIPTRLQPSAGFLNVNQQQNLGRTRYRDEYVSDIVVVKFERAGTFDVTNREQVGPGLLRGGAYMKANEIIPDYIRTSSDEEIISNFKKAKPLYSVRLMNAFPTNISSIPLSSGASELVKVQVTFEYETAVTSAHNNGTVQGSIETII